MLVINPISMMAHLDEWQEHVGANGLVKLLVLAPWHEALWAEGSGV